MDAAESNGTESRLFQETGLWDAGGNWAMVGTWHGTSQGWIGGMGMYRSEWTFGFWLLAFGFGAGALEENGDHVHARVYSFPDPGGRKAMLQGATRASVENTQTSNVSASGSTWDSASVNRPAQLNQCQNIRAVLVHAEKQH
ncbi:hypothetical protein SUNI508_04016 [Seiridium unicorne]|uniref:Uncharacterized protein n=1 Tax=Seiridium unicorne TaxID=138068 RepID=A0ABR2V9D9_9PEZI